MLPWCETGLSTGLAREQGWTFITNTALSQNMRNRSPGETLIIAQCPVVKMALLKVCVPLGQGVGAAGEDIISCYGIPAVRRIMDFFFVNKHGCIEETQGSIIC